MTRFPFAFDLAALPLRLLGIAPSTAWVQVDDDEFAARFGPWRCRTDLANVRDVVVTRDHHAIRAIGPRVSLTDRGATFGTTAAAGVCVTFHEPVAAVTPFAIHPGLTVTVADVDGLADLLRERCGPAT